MGYSDFQIRIFLLPFCSPSLPVSGCPAKHRLDPRHETKVARILFLVKHLFGFWRSGAPIARASLPLDVAGGLRDTS